MTPRMREFLKPFAECEPNKGLPLQKSDAQIAGRAITKGYGNIWGFGSGRNRFRVFSITDKGREALRKEANSVG